MSDSTGGFVHLHTHTEFSMLDGMGRVADVCVEATKDEDGQPAIAMTDHGRLSGAWRFNEAATESGIKPIFGLEAYLAIGDRHEKNTVEVDRDDEDYGDDDEAGENKTKNTKTKRYEHLTILATNRVGWNNLVVMQNKAQETFWSHPRIDYALLKEHSEGLIVLSGCLAGPVAGPLSRGSEDEAVANLRTLIDCVGRNNVYVEIMEHGIPIETDTVLPALIALAQNWVDENGDADPLDMVVTNDAHYVGHDDCDAHDAWLAVQSGAHVADEKRFRFNGEGYHLRTAKEMRGLIRERNDRVQSSKDRLDDLNRIRMEDEPTLTEANLAVNSQVFIDEKVWETACDNTLVIADRCEDNVLVSPGLQLPTFPVPDGFENADRYFKHLIMAGATAIFGRDDAGKLPAVVNERLVMEFKIITDMGFAEYFLIVWDLIEWAVSDRGLPTAELPDGEPGGKKPILVGPGRGSAAGSLISYCLNIVDLDPLENDLLFERFLEPGRLEMPDIDLDFESARRDEVLEFLALRWGRKNVSRIGSFSQSLSRRALKDASRVHERTDIGNAITKLIDVKGGKPLSFKVLFDENNRNTEPFRHAIESGGEDLNDVMASARKFEGVVNGESQHACGVLIAPHDLTNLVPIRYDRAPKAAKDAFGRPTTMITAWDSKDVEHYGLLKLDVLGLTNLDIIAATFQSVERSTGELLTLKNIPHPATKNDPRIEKTWDLLCTGNTAGVFQLESDGITRLTEDVQPRTFEDLSAIIALFRPGPLSANMHTRYVERKHDREDVDYGIFTEVKVEQEAIAAVLDETWGVYVYQEQIMRLGTVMAGFDVVGRSKLRKAVGKKDAVLMAQVGEAFLTGCTEEQFDDDGNLISMAFLESTAHTMWDAMKGSAEYLFNKSHTAAYAKLSYYTAYLKANWPVEYGAAILAVTDKDDKRYAALRSLEADGIPVLPPDVNFSSPWTAPELDPETLKPTGNVRLGLSEIKGVGVSGAHICDEREANGAFVSLHDLMSRVKAPLETALPDGYNEDTGLHNSVHKKIDTVFAKRLDDLEGALSDENMETFLDSLKLDDATEPSRKKLNLTAVEGLIQSGATDEFGSRLGLTRISRSSSEVDYDVPDCEWPSVFRSMLQRERLGIAVGEHPLVVESTFLHDWRTPEPAETKYENMGSKPSPLSKIPKKGGTLTMGVIAAWSEHAGSRGRFARFTLEGSTSRIEGQVWSESLADIVASGYVPSVGDVVAVSGYVKTRVIETVLESEDEDVDGSVAADKREVQELSANKMWRIDVPHTLEAMPVNKFKGGIVTNPTASSGRILASLSASAGMTFSTTQTPVEEPQSPQNANLDTSIGILTSDANTTEDEVTFQSENDVADDDLEDFDGAVVSVSMPKPVPANIDGFEDYDETIDVAVNVVEHMSVQPDPFEPPPDTLYDSDSDDYEDFGGNTAVMTRPAETTTTQTETQVVTQAAEPVVLVSPVTEIEEDEPAVIIRKELPRVVSLIASTNSSVRPAVEAQLVGVMENSEALAFGIVSSPFVWGTVAYQVWRKKCGNQDVYVYRVPSRLKPAAVAAVAAGYEPLAVIDTETWADAEHGCAVATFDAEKFTANINQACQSDA